MDRESSQGGSDPGRYILDVCFILLDGERGNFSFVMWPPTAFEHA